MKTRRKRRECVTFFLISSIFFFSPERSCTRALLTLTLTLIALFIVFSITIIKILEFFALLFPPTNTACLLWANNRELSAAAVTRIYTRTCSVKWDNEMKLERSGGKTQLLLIQSDISRIVSGLISSACRCKHRFTPKADSQSCEHL